MNPTSAVLSLTSDKDESPFDDYGKNSPDTLRINDQDGQEVIIMRAVRDEDGEMVANDVISAAYVTARFRNIAERHGKISLAFNITVPESMQDSKWQLRFHPVLHILEDSVKLDPLLITGSDYRKAQLRGYQLYDRFLNSIVSDSTVFINKKELSIFLKRNIPEVYAFKDDSSLVDEDAINRILEENNSMYSLRGVSKNDAVEHYTDKLARWINRRRISNIDRKRIEYIKSPIIEDGIRLDTVIREPGEYVYCYTSIINTKPLLRKVDVTLSGEIWDQDKLLYSIPYSEPLTFYVSSLTTFVDDRVHYMTSIIERRVEANTACYIGFELGKSEVKEDYSENIEEIGRIKYNILELLENNSFDLDSILVVAASSPEGEYKNNELLSLKRSRAVSSYFTDYIRHCQDSLAADSFSIGEDGEVVPYKRTEIPFKTSHLAENWDMLDRLVETDADLTDAEKTDYALFKDISDYDLRESMLSKKSYYKHLRESLYPRVRTVKFEFYLHRKGMVKDTIHTTSIDTTYMNGIKALKDRDYEKAVTLLREYEDYNSAIAYCCMGYDNSALSILSKLPQTAEVNYMMAILYSRMGDDRRAVELYRLSCQQDPSFVHRGNLDPEISSLISKYDLNKEDDI